MLKIVKKQLCVHGHDTYLTGRYSNGACKVCDRKRHKEFYHSNPDYQYNTNVKYKRFGRYGITSEQYDTLLVNQQNKCQMCQTSQENLKRTLSVDHDHKTGKIRGLLCGACNLILGLAKDNSKVLQAGIEYLNLK